MAAPSGHELMSKHWNNETPPAHDRNCGQLVGSPAIDPAQQKRLASWLRRSDVRPGTYSHPNYPNVAFTSAPSASSAAALSPAGLGASQLDGSSHAALARPGECCSESGSSPLSRTLLTVLTFLTVFSRDMRILMILLPARPSRLKVMSMPSARRKVCARRK